MTPQPSAASGYVLVPREPTTAMVEAGRAAMKAAPDLGGIVSQYTPEVMDVYAAMLAAAPTPPGGEVVEMSPEFTDSARAALAWVLFHHQGGSSPVGQPIRFALGMGRHDELQAWRIDEAKRYAAWAGATTEDFHTTPPAAVASKLRELVEVMHSEVSEVPEGTADAGDAWERGYNAAAENYANKLQAILDAQQAEGVRNG